MAPRMLAAHFEIPTACSMCRCDFVMHSIEKKKFSAKKRTFIDKWW
jgi:hypothetical protein